MSRKRISLEGAVYLSNVVIMPRAMYRLKLSRATAKQIDAVQASMRRLLNIKPSALPRWGEGGAIRSLAVEREGTTSNGVGGATQYVDNGRVEGSTCMRTCGERR